jgi:hypothetical protein
VPGQRPFVEARNSDKLVPARHAIASQDAEDLRLKSVSKQADGSLFSIEPSACCFCKES